MNAKAANRELSTIAKTNGGVLLPSQVVDFARNPKTALHKKFEWDDTEAAEKYRLAQAQEVIRHYKVSIVQPNKDPVVVRAFISLGSERVVGGGPYRPLEVVLKKPEYRRRMLQDALDELDAFRAKYEMLKELKPIIEAIKKARAKHRRKPR